MRYVWADNFTEIKTVNSNSNSLIFFILRTFNFGNEFRNSANKPYQPNFNLNCFERKVDGGAFDNDHLKGPV